MTIALVTVAVLAVALLGAIMLIVRRTHRLPASEPLHQDPADLAAPLPLDVAAADSLTARELDAERDRDRTPAA